MVFLKVKKINSPSMVRCVSGRHSHAHSRSPTNFSQIHEPTLVLGPRRSTGDNCAQVVTRHPDNDTEEEEEEEKGR